MPLATGAKLGSYEVAGAIGAGGMGEVYEARDTKLGRHLAIKVLPAAFVNDPERLARFQREARTLAALNHPNIATIHGLEHSDGTQFLIMELVSGETLADRVKSGPIQAEEAFIDVEPLSLPPLLHRETEQPEQQPAAVAASVPDTVAVPVIILEKL